MFAPLHNALHRLGLAPRPAPERLVYPHVQHGARVHLAALYQQAFPERLSAADTQPVSPYVAPWLDAAYLAYWQGNQVYNVGYGTPPVSWIVTSNQNSSPAQRAGQAVGPVMSTASTAAYLDRMRAAWQAASQPRPTGAAGQ